MFGSFTEGDNVTLFWRKERREKATGVVGGFEEQVGRAQKQGEGREKAPLCVGYGLPMAVCLPGHPVHPGVHWCSLGSPGSASHHEAPFAPPSVCDSPGYPKVCGFEPQMLKKNTFSY